ncbi:MAG: cytochrome c [Verrucomicrobiales bacterium]|nr:cytochrome c [Verrucomicrobiales bacterium]MCB1245452.1 cytochrome c [Verrucomicrobiae bacterium]MCP5555562.1 cytochrome c [Akkermansiaceae bacterium]
MKILTASILAATILITDSSLQAQPTAPASFMLCMACHGPDGKGMGAGTPTPMAPPLAGSKLANFGDGELMSSIVFTGIEKQDAKYLGIMAPLGPAMTDAQMAEALSYVRKSFGNNAPVVTADQIKAWREKYNGKPMQKRAALEAKLK